VLALLAFRARTSLEPVTREAALVALGPATGVALALVLFLPPYWGAFGWRGDLPFPQGKTSDGHPWIGATAPKLTVEEITDYACPHCRVASARALKHVAAHEGTLRVVRRQYPRMDCPPGRSSACQPLRAAYCAEEQGKFWQMDRWLFEHAQKGTVKFDAAAADVGLDAAKLAACVEREDTYARAAKESKFWAKKHLLGTPAYRIDGKTVSVKDAEARMSAGR
jgi:protein-disulfide isomerase